MIVVTVRDVSIVSTSDFGHTWNFS